MIYLQDSWKLKTYSLRLGFFLSFHATNFKGVISPCPLSPPNFERNKNSDKLWALPTSLMFDLARYKDEFSIGVSTVL